MIPEPERPSLTPLSAHPALAAASDYADKCASVERQRFGTRAYYDALAACDEAWEKIASAALAPTSAAPADLLGEFLRGFSFGHQSAQPATPVSAASRAAPAGVAPSEQSSVHPAAPSSPSSLREVPLSEPCASEPSARPVWPLTDEQRTAIVKRWKGGNWTCGDIIDAVEAAHGIATPVVQPQGAPK
jgi:hypothetical protein